MNRIGLAVGVAIALAGCSAARDDGARGGGDRLAEVRAALVAHDYGQGVKLAKGAVTAAPHDPKAQFELARAEALIDNQGAALDALGAAVDAGLADPATALEDPAFDAMRGSPRFAAIRDRATPGASGAGVLAAGEGSGRVTIDSRDGHDTVRAGDVVLDGDF